MHKGQTVYHASFGRGVVLAVLNDGRAADIRFESIPRFRTILSSFLKTEGEISPIKTIITNVPCLPAEPVVIYAPKGTTQIQNRVLSMLLVDVWFTASTAASLIGAKKGQTGTVARAIRALRELGYRVDSRTNALGACEYKIIKASTEKSVIMAVSRKGARNASTVNPDEARKYFEARFPDYTTKDQAARDLDIGPDKVESLFALMRDLRKPYFGGRYFEARKFVGVWEYRLHPVADAKAA